MEIDARVHVRASLGPPSDRPRQPYMPRKRISTGGFCGIGKGTGRACREERGAWEAKHRGVGPEDLRSKGRKKETGGKLELEAGRGAGGWMEKES